MVTKGTYGFSYSYVCVQPYKHGWTLCLLIVLYYNRCNPHCRPNSPALFFPLPHFPQPLLHSISFTPSPSLPLLHSLSFTLSPSLYLLHSLSFTLSLFHSLSLSLSLLHSLFFTLPLFHSLSFTLSPSLSLLHSLSFTLSPSLLSFSWYFVSSFFTTT